jgi:hypothetical protein
MAFEASPLGDKWRELRKGCERRVRCDGEIDLKHGQAQGISSALVRTAERLVERIVGAEGERESVCVCVFVCVCVCVRVHTAHSVL